MANSKSATFTIFIGILLGVTSFAVARMFDDGSEVFLEDSGFCFIADYVLICDFQWKLEFVYLDEYPACTGDEKCQTIIIQRVHNFYFDTSLCIDLTLKHITKVTLQGESLSDCLSMGLNIQNVTLDFIHDGMTSVYADESHIKQLSFSTKAGHLTVIGSQVDVLSIKDVMGDDTTVKIQGSKIKDFERLQISGKGRFHLLDSTVEDFPPDSLILDSSKWNLISGVTLNKFDEDSPASIILINGSDITLEEVKGSVKISSLSCPVIFPASYRSMPSTRVSDDPEKQPEGRLSEDPEKPPEGTWNEKNLEHILGYSSYPWMVTALTGAITVNFLQTCIIISLLFNKYKKKSQVSR
ncbi:uncharacterized protein [Palaemon carinicauda]|uniref:uncharacterized protein isoform X2 n=1 Tax=Palaemon carinicauda TaxID=392227 RepID=UPI0035B677ED